MTRNRPSSAPTTQCETFRWPVYQVPTYCREMDVHIPRMTKMPARRSYVLRRAIELAKSGDFTDYSGIEAQLRIVEGYPEATQVLDDLTLRDRLNQMCKEAKKR